MKKNAVGSGSRGAKSGHAVLKEEGSGDKGHRDDTTVTRGDKTTVVGVELREKLVSDTNENHPRANQNALKQEKGSSVDETASLDSAAVESAECEASTASVLPDEQSATTARRRSSANRNAKRSSAPAASKKTPRTSAETSNASKTPVQLSARNETTSTPQSSNPSSAASKRKRSAETNVSDTKSKQTKGKSKSETGSKRTPGGRSSGVSRQAEHLHSSDVEEHVVSIADVSKPRTAKNGDPAESTTQIPLTVPPNMSSVLVADHPYVVSSSLLELSLQRSALIDAYFEVAEQMMLMKVTECYPANDEDAKYGLLEENMYQWMTQRRGTAYKERFTPEQRRARREALRTHLQRRRVEHQQAMSEFPMPSTEEDTTATSNILSHSLLKQNALRAVQPTAKARSSASRLTAELATESNSSWLDSWIKRQKETEHPNSRLCSQLQFLQARVVRMCPIVEWSPREVAMFQLALCTYGPDFLTISRCIGSKSYKETYSFYAEVFKQTLRYKIFKDFKKYAEWWHAAQPFG